MTGSIREDSPLLNSHLRRLRDENYLLHVLNSRADCPLMDIRGKGTEHLRRIYGQV